jgi:hypothetical protein
VCGGLDRFAVSIRRQAQPLLNKLERFLRVRFLVRRNVELVTRAACVLFSQTYTGRQLSSGTISGRRLEAGTPKGFD